MRYTVIKIEEDIDFGCEERADDSPVMAVVTLKNELGEESKMLQPDQMLYDRDINEGDIVIVNEEKKLQKILDSDWTKNCTTRTVNTTKFVDMMQKVKSGMHVDWICPFCGGEVSLLKQEDGHTVIGCKSCDMRINLDEKTLRLL